MRALLCSCHRHLEAPDQEALFTELLDHLGRDHPVVALSETQIRQIVAEHSYHYEYSEVYAGRIEPDEEFGLEPY